MMRKLSVEDATAFSVEVDGVWVDITFFTYQVKNISWMADCGEYMLTVNGWQVWHKPHDHRAIFKSAQEALNASIPLPQEVIEGSTFLEIEDQPNNEQEAS